MADVVETPAPSTIVTTTATPFAVEADATSTVVESHVESHVIATTLSTVVVQGVGVQGPPGPAGARGPRGEAGSGGGGGSHLSFEVQAGFDLPPFHVVAPRMTDTSVRLASNDVLAYVDRPLWLTLAGALAGESVEVVSEGLVENAGWSWGLGPIYLGTDGQLTQIPPSAEQGAAFSAQLGYATAPTCMFFERAPAVLLAI